MLSEDQVRQTTELLRVMSQDGLSKLKAGSIEGSRDNFTKITAPDLLIEHRHFKELVKEECEAPKRPMPPPAKTRMSENMSDRRSRVLCS